MRFLIRFLSKTAAGSVEHTDRIVDAPVITIGRATDQILHLKDRRARLQHAQIAPKNGSLHISSASMAGVTVNGRSTRDARLSAGDVIEAGANILRVIDAPEGVDFAMTFELNEDAGGEHLEKSWTKPVTGIAGFSKPCRDPPPICGRLNQASYQKRSEPSTKVRSPGRFSEIHFDRRYSTRL